MKKIFLQTFVLFSCACLFACHQEDIVSSTMYSDEYMSKLKFKTIAIENLLKTRTPYIDIKDDEEEHSAVSFGIFSVRIPRPSTGCTHGFGFCDFKWFPDLRDFETEYNNDSQLYQNSFEVQIDESGDKYIEHELTEEPPTFDSNNMQPLIIEEQLESFAFVDDIEEEMIIPKGSYNFNRTIGKFGGYRIPVK